MKIKSRLFLKDQEGNKRIVRKFLFFPRCFENKHWRWLEFASIREQVVCEMRYTIQRTCSHYYWKEVGFVEPGRVIIVKP